MANPMFSPTAPLVTEADAVAAARASAVAIFLGVLYGVLGIIMLMTISADQVRAAAEASAAQAGGMPGMAETVVQFALYSAVGVVVIQAILGWVQWAKPNIVIPIIFVILVAWGLISGVMAIMGNANLPAEAQTPMWQIALNFVILAIQLFLHIIAIRGASKLDKIRKAGPVNEDEFL